MKKLILLSIFFLLPSCSLIEMPTGFGGFMKTIRKLQKQVKRQRIFAIRNVEQMKNFQMNGVIVCNFV